MITIKSVQLCEVVISKSKAKTKAKPVFVNIENIDLKKDNSELLKGKNLDAIIVFQKSITVENTAAEFNKKYPLL